MKKTLLLLAILFVSLNTVNAQKKKNKRVAKASTAKAAIAAPIEKGPSLYIESDIVDYGTIKKGSDRIRKVNITNRGDLPIVIATCTGSCGCTVPTCPKEPIMPGKNAEIEVNYDTNRVGSINKQVTIIYKDSKDTENQRKTLMIRGNVVE